MGKTITVSFENDLPEAELEEIREKIRMVLRGEAVPEAEVVGQLDPTKGRGGNNVGSTPSWRG